MQEDISKMNDKVEQARDGCTKIDDTLKKKLLSVNYDKEKGSKRNYRKTQ